MVIDYLSSNALNKYPFDDNATLISVESPTLSNDTFVDVVVAAKRADVTGAYLVSYIVNTGAQTTTLTFAYIDSSDADIDSIVVVIPFASIIEQDFYGLANSDVSVKIVFGPQFVLDTAIDNSLTFNIGSARLVQSSVLLMDPRVTSLSFYNWDKEIDDVSSLPLVVISGSETVDTDLTITEGTNVAFDNDGTGILIDIIGGAGAGLFNGCEDDGPYIKTINSIGPDTEQNFLFTTDDCYVTDPKNHGLTIDNICTPKCTAEQLSSYAHYLNRVKDGMQWLRDYAVTATNDIQDAINNFVNVTQPAQNRPYYKLKRTKMTTIDDDKYYYSYAIGFFNPSGSVQPVNVSVGTDQRISSVRFKVGELSLLEQPLPVPSPYTVSHNVPCLKIGYLEFVIWSPVGGVVNIDGNFGPISITISETLD